MHEGEFTPVGFGDLTRAEGGPHVHEFRFVTHERRDDVACDRSPDRVLRKANL